MTSTDGVFDDPVRVTRYRDPDAERRFILLARLTATLSH